MLGLHLHALDLPDPWSIGEDLELLDAEVLGNLGLPGFDAAALVDAVTAAAVSSAEEPATSSSAPSPPFDPGAAGRATVDAATQAAIEAAQSQAPSSWSQVPVRPAAPVTSPPPYRPPPYGYGLPSPGAAGKATVDAATQAAIEAARRGAPAPRPTTPAQPSGGGAKKALSFLESLSQGFASFTSPAQPVPAGPVYEELSWLDRSTGPVPNKVIAGVGVIGAMGLLIRSLR